ncbi:MAG: sugar-binding protein [Gammaproteobacteria bacterium]
MRARVVVTRMITTLTTDARQSSLASPSVWASALMLLVLIEGAQSQEAPVGSQPKTIEIVRTDTVPTIDGRLNEPIWEVAAIIDDLHQVRPVEYAEPSEPTRVYLLFDKDALYVAARMSDSNPDQIAAHILRQGENIVNDDEFALILDPFNERRSGYRFEVNANGVRHDAIYQNTTQQQPNWDGIYRAAATTDEEGWVVEMAIPFKTVSFNPNNDAWGINFERILPRRDERMGWVSRNRDQNPSTSGVVVGMVGLDQGLGLDIVPSISLRERRTLSPFNSDFDTEPSLDLFYKITPSLNGSLTLNTDFSATEVDDRQVNLTRFSLFFPEKRAFFLRDSDIFRFGRIGGGDGTTISRQDQENGRPFFSRRIGLSRSGEPVGLKYGGKVSGRLARWNLGALSIQQNSFQSVDPIDVFVGRAAANVLEESSVGLIITDGDPRSNLDNSLVGVDFRYLNSRLSGGRTIEADAWYQQTETEGLLGNDSAYGLRFRMPNNRRFRWGLGTKELQENFRPALGFVNRAGIRSYTFELGYTHLPRERYLQTIFGGVDAQRIDFIDGGLQSQVISIRPLELQNHTRDEFNLRYTASKEVLRDHSFEISEGVVIPIGEYSLDEYGFDLQTGRQRKLSGRLGYRTGEFYDGERESISGGLIWKASRHFWADIGYEVNEVDLPQGNFTTRLVRLKLDAVFSSTLSWVNLIQYDNVSGTLGINSRLHWTPEAGRDAYLVLNHNLDEENQGGSFHSSALEAVIKFNYTFRF